MYKSEKELAFLRDLSVDSEWTERFTEHFDKNYKFTDEESILYINVGTGNHALALREKLDPKIEIYGVTENEHFTVIAKAKAAAVKADIDFSSLISPDRYDLVIADATFVRPSEIAHFIDKICRTVDDRIAMFLPTTGSFGEVFSMLWEVLLEHELADKTYVAEKLVKELPTVSEIEEILKSAGLKKIRAKTDIEIFEFENGKEFVESTLVSDFLLPQWLAEFTKPEKNKIRKLLAKTIDRNRDDLTFRFTVKASMFGAVK